MSDYDEVSVVEDNKVNINPSMGMYQLRGLGSKFDYLNIDKDGFISYDAEPGRVINSIELTLGGEDSTGRWKEYLLAVVMNKIEGVWEKEDENTYIELYLNPGIKLAAKRMSHRMTPLHGRNSK